MTFTFKKSATDLFLFCRTWNPLTVNFRQTVHRVASTMNPSNARCGGDHVLQIVIISLALSGFVAIAHGARCSSVVRAFAHGSMGRWIDPSWGGPIELFLVPASAPQLV